MPSCAPGRSINQQNFTRNPTLSRDTGQKPRFAARTDIGLVRSSNQDAILADPQLGLWLVADGMGGHAGGAQASQLACSTIQSAVHDGASLHAAILAAHYAIRAGQAECADLAEMGTTVVAMLEHAECFEVVWVGDSRAYLYDQPSGRLQRLTHDHTLVGLMVERGELSLAEAARHPRRHVLTDCLGQQAPQEPRIDRVELRWGSGQLLMLCSDGLSGELDDEAIASVLKEHLDPDTQSRLLLERAMAAGARDNVSIILIRSPRPGRAPRERSSGWRGWLRRSSRRD